MVTISILLIFIIVAACIVATYFIAKSIFKSEIADIREAHGALLNAIAEDRDTYKAQYNKAQFELNKVVDDKRLIEITLEGAKDNLALCKRSKDVLESELTLSKKTITSLEEAIAKADTRVKNVDSKLEASISTNMLLQGDLKEVTSDLEKSLTKVEALKIELDEVKSLKLALESNTKILEKEVEETRESQLESEGIATRTAEYNTRLSIELESIRNLLGDTVEEEKTTYEQVSAKLESIKNLETIYTTAKYFNLVFLTMLNAALKELPSRLAIDSGIIGKPIYPNLKFTTKNGRYEITNSTSRKNLEDKLIVLGSIGDVEFNATEIFNQITTNTFQVESLPPMEALEANLISLFGNI